MRSWSRLPTELLFWPPPNVFCAVTDTEKLKQKTDTPTVSVAVPVTDETPPRSS